ncbi:glycoside hydrolase family 127 protein [Nonomuraea sp. LPB2021202275-12-8]|uniref:glycoside hydrolase family 127 protein n=1 Tax=Nonomuraea sp. LPB2021202275-12-8 TaxID=3120159 RepID=UPI00300D873E
MNAGSVWPTPAAKRRLYPVDASNVEILGGFWALRQRLNREKTILHGFGRLQQHGALGNLRLAAGGPGRYQAEADSGGTTFPFLDSDVYKWLEAVGWELARGADPALTAAAEEAIGVVAAAQRPDGYLNSFVQVVGGGVPYGDLAFGHEFYCVAHLIQAAVAWHRGLGDDRLLTVATRAVAHVDAEFGAQGRAGIDGHPGMEMALVELARVTGEERHLALAARMLGLIGHGHFGAQYWQDHEPVHEAATVAGHAVRQLYLDCGAVDVAVELGDEALLTAVRRRWSELTRSRTYLTGGTGSRHRDEAFGDPYELPPDRAYAETCAAIASVMLAWRLLLATGEWEYADAIERAMYNGVLSGISLSGEEFFYTNPLQRRTHHTAEPGGHSGRAPWHACACCPPNLMRLFSSWHHYLATSDEGGIQIHQYADADMTVGDVRLSIRTEYPWQGRVTVHILQTPDRPWTLSLRVPAWSRSADGPVVRHARRWNAGDSVVLDLEPVIRVTVPDRRADAIRGCVAVERGPLVYCLETADAPATTKLEDLAWDGSRQPLEVPRSDIEPAMIGVNVPVVDLSSAPPGESLTAGAIPYFAWANRQVGAMRVWIPA